MNLLLLFISSVFFNQCFLKNKNFIFPFYVKRMENKMKKEERELLDRFSFLFAPIQFFHLSNFLTFINVSKKKRTD